MNGTAQAPGELPSQGTNGGKEAFDSLAAGAVGPRRLTVVDPFLPRAHGLYRPGKEHDSCGVGFVADMRNRKSHDILQ